MCQETLDAQKTTIKVAIFLSVYMATLTFFLFVLVTREIPDIPRWLTYKQV